MKAPTEDRPYPVLRMGTGVTPYEGGCVMQAASFLWDGSSWNDDPSCVNPILRDAAIRVNDLLDVDERQRLWPLVPRLMGTVTVEWPSDNLAVAEGLMKAVRPDFYRAYAWGESPGVVATGVACTLVRHAASLVPEGQLVDWLVALLDEYDRITGRTAPWPVSEQRWAKLGEVMRDEMFALRDEVS